MPNHNGKCRELHGHTYKMEIFVADKPKSWAVDDSDAGMVMDFDEIKRAYEHNIEPYVEHKNLNDTLGDALGVTTAEYLAEWACCKLLVAIPKIEGVRVWETPTSYAEYWLD